MPGKDIHEWRKAISGEDPEAKKFADSMFKTMEAQVFENLNDYVISEGKHLASTLSNYGKCKDYDFSKEEVLEGFKASAPVIQEMVKKAWEHALGVYFHGKIDAAEAAKKLEAASK